MRLGGLLDVDHHLDIASSATVGLGQQATVVGPVELTEGPGHACFRRILGVATVALKHGADSPSLARSSSIRPPSTTFSEFTRTRGRENPSFWFPKLEPPALGDTGLKENFELVRMK